VRRRQICWGLAVAGLAALAAPGRVWAETTACEAADEDAGVTSLRQSLHYSLPSRNADKHCQSCAFFTAAPDVAACGSCQLIGGPVTAIAACDSWAHKS
jgi:hypothetical protein